MKDKKIKIKSICASRNVVYGLGSDGKVYLWNQEDSSWYLFDY